MTNPTNVPSNPEDSVIDRIDRLVDETMAAGVDAFGAPLDDFNADRYDRCPHCNSEWHGLPKRDFRGVVYCPGSTVDSVSPSDQSELPPVVGGPAVLLGGGGGGMWLPQVWPDEDDGGIAGQFNSAMLMPMQAVSYDALTIPPLFNGDPLQHLTDMIRNVLTMLGEVFGIHLDDNDIEGATEALSGITESHRLRREREEYFRQHMLTYSTAPPDGYTLRDADQIRRENRTRANYQALQGLRSRRRANRQADTQEGVGDDERWESCARAALCDSPSNGEESQANSSARSASGEDV